MYVCIPKKAAHRVLLGIAAVLCAGGVALAALREPPAVETAGRLEWGLSFQKENAGPIPNVSAEKLRPYNAFYCGDTTQKKLYLTFDCGYENGNTTAILDALKKHNAPGAFFVVGPFVKENPELISRMINEGHTLGNHTYHHPDMSQKDKESFAKELHLLEETFLSVAGRPLDKFYRPPQGNFSTENLQWAQELGYSTIFWSLAYVDWKTENQPSAEQAFAKIMPRTSDGAIVLLHSTSATNAAILDELLSKWEAMGYTFGRLDELAALPNPAASAPPAAAPQA